MISVYITCKDEEEAVRISKHLLLKKLVACTNYFPIKSMYFWQGKLENSDEIVIFAKSISDKYKEIVSEVKKVHSYEVPAILKFEVTANSEYENWCKEEID